MLMLNMSLMYVMYNVRIKCHHFPCKQFLVLFYQPRVNHQIK